MILELEKALADISRKLEVSINQKVQIGDLFLVRVDSDKTIKYGNSKLDRNIYAFNEHGEEIWQIEAAPVKKSPKPYVNLKAKDGKIIAENWTGIDVLVDISNGFVKPILQISALGRVCDSLIFRLLVLDELD